MGKGGQRRSRRNSNFFDKLKDGLYKKVSPHSFIENSIIKFEKMDEAARSLWASFQNYLAAEREKLLDDITDALLNTSLGQCSEKNYSRIVGSAFSRNPLSSIGSILRPPGGRFNIGKNVSFSTYFPALYIASNYETAFKERYGLGYEEKTKDGLGANDLNNERPDSFSHFRMNFSLDKVIDLRDDKAINNFFDIISPIKMPGYFEKKAKELNVPMAIVKTPENLRKAIFDPYYTQWDTWIDQPSPSQWFGHYVHLAGIQGIIYPSTKNNSGSNIAIFLDNFDSESSYVELTDPCDFVPEDLKRVNRDNYFKFTQI